MPRTERIATMAESHIDRHGKIHVLAEWERTACGLPTTGAGPEPHTECRYCTRCVEAVLSARSGRRRERARAALQKLVQRPHSRS